MLGVEPVRKVEKIEGRDATETGEWKSI